MQCQSRSQSSSELNEEVRMHVVCAGDNFFKTTPYTIEAVLVDANAPARQLLQDTDAKLLAKKESLRKFEIEFREVR